MDSLLGSILSKLSVPEASEFGMGDVFIPMSLAFILSLALTEIYKICKNEISYTPSFLVTVIVIAISTTVDYLHNSTNKPPPYLVSSPALNFK